MPAGDRPGRGLNSLARSKRKTELLGRIFVYATLVIASIVILIPVFWMLSTALKEDGEVYLFPPQWIPTKFLWGNFVRALTFLPFGRYFTNTVIVTFSSMFGQLLSSSLVAYGFARLRARARDMLFILVLATMMIPSQVTMIPLFVLFKQLNWVDTFKPLIVPNFFGSAFFIFLLRQFFMTIPIELDDAAKIDGCGYLGIYGRVLMPLTKPALATVAIFGFMWNWNDFMGPLIYLNSRDKLTVSLALSRFTGMYGMTAWNLLMAASLVVALPCLVLFFFTQRYFIQGIVITGLKG
ncbi:MAG: carbohydrate ABC transporter permease [Firmicutes bacterium]|nr:carbohydrate ABC transporter permease [Bacillota bacterium]